MHNLWLLFTSNHTHTRRKAIETSVCNILIGLTIFYMLKEYGRKRKSTVSLVYTVISYTNSIEIFRFDVIAG